MSTEQEFIALLNQHQKIIHKVCNLYMDLQADREDLFQEITLQAWKAYGKFRGDAKFSTWLYRVALNTAITFFRNLQDHVRERLAAFKVPAHVYFRDDPLPRNPQGKVLKRDLKAEILGT